MDQDRLEHTSPQTHSANKRTPGQWAILLTAWPVGLVIWAVYLAAIGLLILRIL